MAPPSQTSLQCWIFFNCCKYTVKSFSQKAFCLFHSLKCLLLALFDPFKDCNDKFPCSFIHFKQQNPCHFVYLKPEKGTPFGRSLRVQAILRSTPPSRGEPHYTFGKIKFAHCKCVLQIPQDIFLKGRVLYCIKVLLYIIIFPLQLVQGISMKGLQNSLERKMLMRNCFLHLESLRKIVKR